MKSLSQRSKGLRSTGRHSPSSLVPFPSLTGAGVRVTSEACRSGQRQHRGSNDRACAVPTPVRPEVLGARKTCGPPTTFTIRQSHDTSPAPCRLTVSNRFWSPEPIGGANSTWLWKCHGMRRCCGAFGRGLCRFGKRRNEWMIQIKVEFLLLGRLFKRH